MTSYACVLHVPKKRRKSLRSDACEWACVGTLRPLSNLTNPTFSLYLLLLSASKLRGNWLPWKRRCLILAEKVGEGRGECLWRLSLYVASVPLYVICLRGRSECLAPAALEME